LLAPFIAFAAWRMTAGSGGPSRVALTLAAVALFALAASLVWLAEEAALPRGDAYVPAQLQDNRVVPGHGARQ
jgi:hypothetical protein